MKHIHFIGICGVAMSALAIAFKKAGYTVTGSDKGFYPPISTHLRDAGVDFYPGWHVNKMGTPDLVVVGNVASSTNPEFEYIQKNNILYKSYPEVVKDFIIAKNSIVCAGTYGKTTSSTLMTWILKESGYGLRHMFGGLSVNEMDAASLGERPSAPLGSAQGDHLLWSVVEGDEYKSARWDNGAKFFHYSPTHLLLTAVVWDHADVYPTEESYVEAFEKLVNMVPKNGLIVISEKAKQRLANLPTCKLATYGTSEENDYRYTNVKTSKDGTEFDIIHNKKTYRIKSSQLGEYCADNFTGCFAVAREIGIVSEKIIAAIESFKGVKRRLEKRLDGPVTVFDDIAHSPSKAEAVLAAVRKIYSGKVIAVFEPNTGNRKLQSAKGYDNAFISADTVIIPKLTTVKKDPNDMDKPMVGEQLASVIAKTHQDVRYIDEDKTLIETIVKEAEPDNVIIFLGSHGFRGMIEELVHRLA